MRLHLISICTCNAFSGIYVPRPQVTNPTRAMQCLEKRKDMHATIMQYVRETLKTTAKGTPEQVYKKLEAYLVSQKVSYSRDLMLGRRCT